MAESRRPAALVRLRRYAGMEEGYEPITTLAAAEDLLEHDCLVYATRPQLVTWQLTSPSGRRVDLQVSGRLVAGDLNFLQRVALAGGGIALLPGFTTEADIEAGQLEEVLADYRTPTVRMQAVYPSSRGLPAKVRAFLDFIKDQAPNILTITSP